MKRNVLIWYCILMAVLLSQVNAQNTLKIEEIEIVNLGDGQQYAHKRDDDKTPLEGKIRIITGYTTEYIDADFKEGYAEGRWEYYKKNKLNSYVTYKNGYLNGECGELDYSGEPKETGNYKNGKKDGKWYTYYSGDEVKEMKEYKDDELRKTIEYFTDGSISSERNFLNKKEHGAEKRYDWETGRLKTDKYYENGKPVGKQMQYYSSNRDDYIQVSNYSKDGKLHGKYTETYAETNKIKVEGQYKDGKKTGTWRYGTKDGKITKEEKYQDNKLIETKKIEN